MKIEAESEKGVLDETYAADSDERKIMVRFLKSIFSVQVRSVDSEW